MANQNLSQFTEKLFVADADHTFIWDTVGAISKRVSRNSWLNSGTLTSDAPVTISQTWNNAAVAFTGLKVNAVSTASASGSLLLDLQVGGASQLKLSRTGFLTIGSGNAKLEYEPGNTLVLKRSVDGLATITLNPEGNTISVGTLIPTNKIANSGLTASVDFNDGANTFAVRNSTNAQTFNVYGTYTSGTSYERLTLSAPSAANAIIGTNKGSGGGTARGLDLHTDGVARMSISTAGNVGIGTTAPGSPLDVFKSAAGADATGGGLSVLRSTAAGDHRGGAIYSRYISGGSADFLVFGVTGVSGKNPYTDFDQARMVIGHTGNVGIGTTSPTSKLHVAGDVTLPNGGSIFFGGGYNIYGTTSGTLINGPTAFGSVAMSVNGVIKWLFNYDGLLCGGGTTAAFPALKRSSTTIQARLADDTAFAPIQGKLTTDTAYTATVVAATGYITIYDSIGTAYRVPCAV